MHSSGLARRVAVVSGAAHGIGAAIAEALVRDGAKVWVCDVLEEPLEETVRRCRDAGGDAGSVAVGRVVDVSRPDAVRALIAEITAQDGGTDILVHSAGGVLGQVAQPVEEVTEDDWRAIVAVNLEAAFLLVREVVPGMKARGWGRIVTISSGAGRSYSQTGIQAYASAKAGLIGFTRQIARELGQFGITANSVAPGFVLSNPSSQRQWEALGAAGQQAFFNALAIKRLGRPEEIAHAALFFASEEAGYVTGQTLSVDGGRWMLG
ncbi:MAG: SDR family NAD(P)-dependent oxidoreductase [bacterium]|nr:SDR family NAD(P)-dependent oxidoreductase [bacterium]